MAYTFPLDPGEKLIMEVRRHWVALLPILISSALLLIGSIYLSYLFGVYATDLGLAALAPIIPLAMAAMAGLGIIVLLGGWYIYRENRVILTSLHLVKVEQNGLFSKNVSQFSLDQLEHVTATRRGFFATILNYGIVSAETSGDQANLVFVLLARPQLLADAILQAQDEFPTESKPK